MSKDALNCFISELYQRYHVAMLRRARKYVHNSCDAEDIVSDCWVNLILHAEQLSKMVSSAQTVYIMRCVTNKSIDLLRNRHRSAEWICDDREYPILCPNAIEPDFSEEALLQKMEVAHLLYLLPPREQEVMKLRLRKWGTDEIADKLHISKSSVRGYAARATARLRSYVRSVENEGER